VFALKSFKVWTPDAVANCQQKGCEVNLVGIKTNGQKVSYKQKLVVDGSRYVCWLVCWLRDNADVATERM
jgi:hypothetical protein